MRVGPKNLRLPIILTLAAASALTGCYYPGGPLYSADRYTYESTPWQPWTVTMVDTRTGEPVWSVDVPVGEQVVLSYSKGSGPNEFKPDEIVWALMPAGQRFGSRPNRMPCPPAGARRLDVTLRAVPEAPGATGPGSMMAGEPRKLRNLGGHVMQPIDPVEPVGRPVDPAPYTEPVPEPPPSEPATEPIPETPPADPPPSNAEPMPWPPAEPTPPAQEPPAQEPAPQPEPEPEPEPAPEPPVDIPE